MIKQYKLRFYNFRLVIFLLAISTFGIILVGSAREDLKSKQLAGVIIGLIIMVILSLMDYSWISNFQWIMYGANIVLLLIVRLFGDSANGAARWIDFGFIRFQPTELSKIIIILFLIIQNSENFVNINLQFCVRFPNMMCYLKIKKLLSLDITTFCINDNHQPLHMVFS